MTPVWNRHKGEYKNVSSINETINRVVGFLSKQLEFVYTISEREVLASDGIKSKNLCICIVFIFQMIILGYINLKYHNKKISL